MLLLLLLLMFHVHGTTSSFCTPLSTDKGCTIVSPSCPDTHNLVETGRCYCRWGWCFGKTYRCEAVPVCCSGWSGDRCDVPVCTGGCGDGSCTAPGQCSCPAGLSGDRCETSTSTTEARPLKIMSMNFACRDVAQLSGCDNCPTRFAEIAKAFQDPGSSSFEGVPDLSGVDVLFAQELGTSVDQYADITAALEAAGLIYSTGAPGPVASDSQCNNPPLLLFGDEIRAAGSSLSGLDSGGLVTWSRYPITASHRQNWCGHNLPVPAGYLVTMLDVDGVNVVGVNLHAFPQFDFGVDPEDVRAYQFTEIASLADKLATAMSVAGASYTMVLGGDFNEDAFSLQSTSPGADCGKITDSQVISKFASIGLDLSAACQAGAVGTPSWDPSQNDLAAKFSSGGKHEVLDYIVRHSSSAAGASIDPLRNVVQTLRRKVAWSGTFCENAVLGTLGPHTKGTAHALTDHNVVTAEVILPPPHPSSGGAAVAFRDVIGDWTGGNVAEQATCGQAGPGWGTTCIVDSNCCGSEYSWTGDDYHCRGLVTFECGCSAERESCNLGASHCCGHSDYTSGNGQQCELTTGGFVCIPKLDVGDRCVFDDECHSRRCEWQWSWFSSGYYCVA